VVAVVVVVAGVNIELKQRERWIWGGTTVTLIKLEVFYAYLLKPTSRLKIQKNEKLHGRIKQCTLVSESYHSHGDFLSVSDRGGDLDAADTVVLRRTSEAAVAPTTDSVGITPPFDRITISCTGRLGASLGVCHVKR